MIFGYISTRCDLCPPGPASCGRRPQSQPRDTAYFNAIPRIALVPRLTLLRVLAIYDCNPARMVRPCGHPAVRDRTVRSTIGGLRHAPMGWRPVFFGYWLRCHAGASQRAFAVQTSRRERSDPGWCHAGLSCLAAPSSQAHACLHRCRGPTGLDRNGRCVRRAVCQREARGLLCRGLLRTGDFGGPRFRLQARSRQRQTRRWRPHTSSSRWC